MLAFDTHKFIKDLSGAGMNVEQAEVLADHYTTLLTDRIATKEDVSLLRKDMEQLGNNIEHLKQDLGGKMTNLEERLEGKMVSLEERIESRIVGLEGKMVSLEERLEGKMVSLEERLEGKINNLDEKIDNLKVHLEGKMEAMGKDLLIKMLVSQVGIAGLIVAFLSYGS